VLADEPTGNLDAAAGAAVLELLRDAVTAERAVVMVTHHAEHAAGADRLLQMRDGRIEAPS
jgi:putative ABC transport system ATP-binding protein